MKVSFRDVAIDSMLLPGNWRRRITSKRVQERARSIADLGLIHEPVVRHGTKELLAGLDRVAACSLLGWDKVPCKVVECTDEEAERVRLDENTQRRHDDPSDKESSSVEVAVATAVAEIRAQYPAIPVDGPGRRKTATGIAIARVAKARRVRPGSVRNALWRAKVDAAEAEPSVAGEADRALPSFGLELDPAFATAATDVRVLLTTAKTRAREALHAVKKAAALVPPGRLQHIATQLDELSVAIKAHVPATLCPYCKALDLAQKECAPCECSGWMGKARAAEAPPELLATSPLMVMYRGAIVPAERFAPEENDLEGWFG